jgi:restriction system protein
MPVPPYQQMMLPFLLSLADGNVKQLSEMYDHLITIFHLSEKDISELLPSGTQSRFVNRVQWVKTYFSHAGLIELTGRGLFKITNVGLSLLRENPPEINNHLLMRYPSFMEFQHIAHHENGITQIEVIEETERITPQEALDSSYQRIRRELADELLAKVKECSPSFFEKLVVDLLVAMGYGGSHKDAGRAIGRSGDGGIDGIIKEDKLGLDVVYIQAKRWSSTVGRPVVQEFSGSLDGVRAKKGVMITTSKFTPEALSFANNIEKKIVLIDGETLVQYMIDNNIGVTLFASYEIKKIDHDYYET